MSIELIVIVAEATDGKTVWANRLAMRVETWHALEGTGAQEAHVQNLYDQLARDIPEGLSIRVFTTLETFEDLEEEGHDS